MGNDGMEVMDGYCLIIQYLIRTFLKVRKQQNMTDYVLKHAKNIQTKITYNVFLGYEF